MFFFKVQVNSSTEKIAANGSSSNVQLTNGRRRTKKKFYDELEEEDDVVPDLPVYDDLSQHRFSRLSRSSSVEGFFFVLSAFTLTDKQKLIFQKSCMDLYRKVSSFGLY